MCEWAKLERVVLKNNTPLGLRLMQLIQGFEQAEVSTERDIYRESGCLTFWHL